MYTVAAQKDLRRLATQGLPDRQVPLQNLGQFVTASERVEWLCEPFAFTKTACENNKKRLKLAENIVDPVLKSQRLEKVEASLST